MAGSAVLAEIQSQAATSKPGMPGPFPGKVIGVEHPGSIVNGAYQAEPMRKMMEKGMTALTGAPGWTDAWRSMFEKGDVVGIKVCPVGGAKLSSDAAVLHDIMDGLKEAGVPAAMSSSSIATARRLFPPASTNGFPPACAWSSLPKPITICSSTWAATIRDHFMEMAIIKPGENLNDPASAVRTYAKWLPR